MRMPITGAVIEALIGYCFQVPQKKAAMQRRMIRSLSTMHSSLPPGPKRWTSVSTPRCAFSRNVTTAPMKVSQTKKYRAISSETRMPELKP
jgi:hypothetical protein